MGFPDFSIEGYTKSYLTQEEILTFLVNYAQHFDLERLIKVCLLEFDYAVHYKYGTNQLSISQSINQSMHPTVRTTLQYITSTHQST